MDEQMERVARANPSLASHEGSYVDWPAILAGAVVAAAIAFVFTTFGAALGLAFISPYEGEGSAMAAVVAVAIWMLWTTISSFMAGGYIAGRMRRRIDPASSDEVAVRDGIHGLAVWGAGILLGAFMFGSSAQTVVSAASDAAPAIAETVEGTAASGASETVAETTAAPTEGVSAEEMMAQAETARGYSILSAFVIGASLLIAGAAAYWAAGAGGRHRDEGRTFARFGTWQ